MLQLCGDLSNWPMSEHKHIFNHPASVRNECTEIAAWLESQGRWREALTLFFAGMEREADEERKLEILKKATKLLEKSSNSMDCVQAIYTVKHRIRCATAFLRMNDYALAGSHFSASLQIMNRIEPQLRQVYALALQQLPGESINRRVLDSTSSWQSLAPIIDFDLRVLQIRGSRQIALPFPLLELNELMEECSHMGQRARHRAFLVESIDVAVFKD